MIWTWTDTGRYEVYDTTKYDLRLKKSAIKEEIERKERLLDTLKQSEADYIEKVAERKSTLKEEIKELKKQLDDD